MTGHGIEPINKGNVRSSDIENSTVRPRTKKYVGKEKQEIMEERGKKKTVNRE